MFFVIPGLLWIKSTVIIIGGIIGVFVSGMTIGVVGAAIINSNSAVPNATALLKSIQETATLVTERATYDIHVSAGIIDGFKGANSYSGEFTGIGEIHTGIDLSEMTQDHITFTDNSYTIQLPPAKFTTCVLSNFSQISHSATLFSVDWKWLYELATIDAYYATTEQGVEAGLLDLAEQKAGEIVSSIVFNLTGKEATILYTQEGRGEGSDIRCTPPFPEGWGKEDLNYNWVRLP
jgi:hypothetical protein